MAEKLFVPFNGEKPAAVVINGHRLVILSHEKEELEGSLALVGADHLQIIEGGDSAEEQEKVLQGLAEMVEGGIVLAPGDIHVEEVIRNLEAQLPWVH